MSYSLTQEDRVDVHAFWDKYFSTCDRAEGAQKKLTATGSKTTAFQYQDMLRQVYKTWGKALVQLSEYNERYPAEAAEDARPEQERQEIAQKLYPDFLPSNLETCQYFCREAARLREKDSIKDHVQAQHGYSMSIELILLALPFQKELPKNDETYQVLAEAYFNRAVLLEKRRQFAGALHDFESAKKYYDQMGDKSNADKVQEKIKALNEQVNKQLEKAKNEISPPTDRQLTLRSRSYTENQKRPRENNDQLSSGASLVFGESPKSKKPALSLDTYPWIQGEPYSPKQKWLLLWNEQEKGHSLSPSLGVVLKR